MAKRRKAGEGTLTKRKDGRWEARVVVSYDEKGMPKTKNVTAVSKAKCLEKLEKLKAELGAVTKKCSPTMPLGEWMDFWYQTYCKNTLKESTQATYEQRIYKQIIPKLGHIPLNQLNAGTLEKFYAQLKSNGRLVRRDIYGPGLSNSVIRSIHAHCRAALEKAVTEKLIRQNPAIGCKLPPKKTPEVKILTPEAMQKLLYQAQIEGFYEMFMLDLATGLRRGEIVGLQWKDIDFANNIITVKRTSQYTKAKGIYTDTTKTKRSKRTIKFPQLIMDLLKEFRIEQLGEAERIGSKWIDNDRLFVKWNGEPMNPQTPYGWFREFCKNNGFRFCDIHSLRHLHASLLINAGIDVVAVSGDMGHSVVGTTLNLYSHMFQEARIRNCDAITEALNFGT